MRNCPSSREKFPRFHLAMPAEYFRSAIAGRGEIARHPRPREWPSRVRARWHGRAECWPRLHRRAATPAPSSSRKVRRSPAKYCPDRVEAARAAPDRPEDSNPCQPPDIAATNAGLSPTEKPAPPVVRCPDASGRARADCEVDDWS